MSKINLNNYEAFVLDHLEGKLSTEDTAELKAFLVLHPELNIDLDNNDLPYLENEISFYSSKEELKKEKDDEVISYIEGLLNEEQRKAFVKKVEADQEYRSLYNTYAGTKLMAETSVVFNGKEALLKSEQAWINNDLAFNYIENELSSAERIAFEKEILSDEFLAGELSLYNKTKLISDSEIVYPNKEELKKEAAVIVLFSTRTILSIAAAILLVIGLIVIFNVYNSDPEVKLEMAKKEEVKESQESRGKSQESRGKSQEIGVEDQKGNSDKSIIERKKEADPKNFAFKNKSEPENNKLNTPDQVKEEQKAIADQKYQSDEKNDPDNILNETRFDDSLAVAEAIKNETAAEKVKVVNENELKKVTLLAYEADDELKVDEEPRKQGFWQKVAKAAGQANKLGMTAVNGNEGEGEGYALSFNSLSIQKK